MTKVAAIATALLVVVLLALPALVGGITEARVRERVAAIDASADAAAELKSFERGWLRSTARIELKLAPDGAAQLAQAAGTPPGVLDSLPIVVELAHGPIAVLDGVYFGWYTMLARPDLEAPAMAELTEKLAVPYLFQFRGRGPYLGGLDFDADAPPFTLPIEEALLTFSGGTMAGTFDGYRLAADAQVGTVDLASPTGTFTVRGVHASADNELRSEYVLPGKTSLSIASVSVTYPQSTTPVVEAANLRVQSDVAIDSAGELLAMRVDYDLDSLRVEDAELTAAAIALRVRNLDVAAVEAYSAAAADAAVAGADTAALAAAFGPHLERALKAAPSVTLDPIRFRYGGEPFEGRIEVTTKPDRLPPAGTLTLENPLLLLELVDTKADVHLSKALAEELAALAARAQLGNDPTIPPDQLKYLAEAQSGLMLTMLVGQGILVEDGDGYRASFDYSDGAATLNGNPLPFGLL
jgi:uncharacterized protein YdgA (DUF945 family)